ncbi:MAG TPA: alanyl-tRNA editing protein [Candidatus Acidoferrum sp.]|jgi:alanyl-tRNA synthetase
MATERLYYDDSFAREFSAEVLRCVPAESNGKPVWEVVLNRTAFYPTSGGQPHDLGTFGDANLLDVRDEDADIVHVVDRPVSTGMLQGRIDWARRFDHIQQHSGQHLLSSILQESFDLPTVSFHLGADFCTIDVRGAEPSAQTLSAVERAANQIIFEDRPVTVRYGTAEELAKIGVRKTVERTGTLRAIEIEGADLQPCGGTHVQRTGQIGMLLIRGISKIRSDWRIEFVCGQRAERVAAQDLATLRGVTEHLKCPRQDVLSAAERAVKERDTQAKAVRTLLERLAEMEATLAVQSQSLDAKGLRVIARVMSAETQPEYLGYFATHLAKNEKTVALLAHSGTGQLVFAAHASAAKDMNATLKEVFAGFAGKGGGSVQFARGQIVDPAGAAMVVDFAAGLVR